MTDNNYPDYNYPRQSVQSLDVRVSQAMRLVFLT